MYLSNQQYVLKILFVLLLLMVLSPTTVATTEGRFETTIEDIWSFVADGPIYGDAAMDPSTAYFATSAGSVYGVNRESGDMLWQFTADGPIYSGVTLTENRLYFQADDGHSYSLNSTTGELLWRSYTGNDVPRNPVFSPGGWDHRSSAPVESGELVYVGSGSGEIFALSRVTGTVVWQYASGAKVRARPLVTEEFVILGNFDGFIYALDKNEGTLVWMYDTHDEVGGPERIYHINSRATLEGDTVYIGSRNTKLYALDVNTGDLGWFVLYDVSWVESPITFYDGFVYTGSSFLRSQLSFAADNGQFVWQSNAIEGLSYAGLVASEEALMTATIATVDPVFNGFLNEGGLVKLARETGELLWFYPFPMDNSYLNSYGAVSTPLVENTQYYVGSLDGTFYRIDEVTTEYPILSFTVDRDELKYREKTKLRWHVIDDHEVRLNGRRVPNKGVRVIRGKRDKTYTLSVEGRLSEQASVEVKVLPASEINLAQYGVATATSSEGTQYLAEFATDDDLSTRWSSAYNDGESLTVDLGRRFNVGRVVIHWENAYASRYTLEASKDGVFWYEIFADDQNQGGSSDIDNLDVRARYIRMNSLERATQWGTSIFEFEVYEHPRCNRRLACCGRGRLLGPTGPKANWDSSMP